MTNIQLYCKTCNAKAKRPLKDQPGCRGTQETACEPAICPKGHGFMARKDGKIQQFIHGTWIVTGVEIDN